MPLPALAGAAPQHDVTEVDISDFWVWNQCTGEWIVCEGTVHYVFHQVTDSSGGSHWMVRGSHNLKGTGLYGNEYQVISTDVMHYNMGNTGLPYEWTYVNTSPLISHGKDTNMRFNIRNQITINANGEITVSFSEVWIDCQRS